MDALEADVISCPALIAKIDCSIVRAHQYRTNALAQPEIVTIMAAISLREFAGKKVRWQLLTGHQSKHILMPRRQKRRT
ncbi:hypothetical protein [Bradyrhizobium ivorense]|uniref:hypothetical protein n=1 Tax=Bradyrhizobium ivorense TaxID=2511166 RepID=UPI0011164E7C|nr:hypothetical protein [Bradyrhizobium ivorense]